MKNTVKEEINRINQLLKEEMFPEPLDRLVDTQNNIEDMAQNVNMMGDEVGLEGFELDDIWGEYGEDFTEKQIDDISGAIHDLGDAAQSLEDAEDELQVTHSQLDDLTKSLQGLNEMRFDGKSTGLFSDEENTMNELEIDEGHCSSKGLDEDLDTNDEIEFDTWDDYMSSDFSNVDFDAIAKGEWKAGSNYYLKNRKMFDSHRNKYGRFRVKPEGESYVGTFGPDDNDFPWHSLYENEEEELPTVRRSDKDMLRRRPYSPKARFKAGLSEQERPPLALDRELSFVLDEIHDDLFYTLPGQFQEYNLGEQVRLYQELKSRLDSYPASKSLPEVKQILDRMEYDLSGLEGFNERLGELFYILTGRYEFSPEARRNS